MTLRRLSGSSACFHVLDAESYERTCPSTAGTVRSTSVLFCDVRRSQRGRRIGLVHHAQLAMRLSVKNWRMAAWLASGTARAHPPPA